MCAAGITGSAELHTTFSRVSFSRIGKTLTVRASNATISGDTVGESATVETSFGGVDPRAVNGSARVTAGNSSTRLSGIAGEAYAKTSFNGITEGDAAGPVTAENRNGSVTVETKPGQKCQPIPLHTSFGPIRVAIPGGTGYNVTARTSFGRIHSDADMTVLGNIGGDELRGKITGGGCEMRLTNQNGNIGYREVAQALSLWLGFGAAVELGAPAANAVPGSEAAPGGANCVRQPATRTIYKLAPGPI